MAAVDAQKLLDAIADEIRALYHPAAALHHPRLRPTLLDDARALREAL